ncbi:diacylglycerol kinase family protein [Novosphingobium sp.]|uniref:diacylglycerol kinase family protein n=1 Tax=Novosphingobium sp. TaxID=1874826 RepID=UPI00163D4CF2|nr:diacylglycerol kinase family protein [Novosphingobium sp.]
MIEPSDVLSARTRFSLGARFRSVIYAWRGLRRLVHGEHNARIHLAASLSVAAAGIWLRVSMNDWRWLVLAMAMVWLAEAFNTAIEELCDRIEPGFDLVIGRIKDIAAGAVLIASLAAALIGVLTLGPPLWVLVQQ